MKKVLIALIATSAIVLSGCTSDKDPVPTPTPSESLLPSETVSGWPTPPTITRVPTPRETTEAPSQPEPTTPRDDQTTNTPVTPAVTPAVPPAIDFAQRWGRKYPAVPEYAILKAANATCRLIETAGTNWNDNALTMAAIETAIGAAGLNNNDALEFAQDANQNYCSSVSNPT